MTALELSAATRVLEIPTEPFTSVAFGDINLTCSDPNPVSVTPEGIHGILRNSNVPVSAQYLSGDGSIEPMSPQHITFIAIYGHREPGRTWGVANLGYCSLELSPESLSRFTSISNVPLSDAATPLPTPHADAGDLAIYALAQTSTGRYVASLPDGVVFSDSETPTGPTMWTPSLSGVYSDDEDVAIVGMWVFEGADVDPADAIDTIAAIRDHLVGGPPEPCGPSTVGPDYQAAAVQAIFGPAASGVVPSTFWGAWLDADLDVIVETGIAVPQDTFGPVSAGVANTAIIDGGTCPASVPAHFALLDAEGGRIVAYAPVTFEAPPVEGDELAFAAGALTFAYGG